MSAAPQKRKASVSFKQGTSQDVRTATTNVQNALGNAFSTGHHSISVRETSTGNSHASTSPSDDGRTSKIKVNVDKHQGNGDEKIGRLTQTVLHEVSLHSQQDLGNKAQGLPETTALQDHQAMYHPDRRGSYLGKTRKTFLQLANRAQKESFADEWHSDVDGHVGKDPATTAASGSEAKKWSLERRQSMVDAISRPERHTWTPQYSLMDAAMDPFVPGQQQPPSQLQPAPSLDDLFSAPQAPQQQQQSHSDKVAKIMALYDQPAPSSSVGFMAPVQGHSQQNQSQSASFMPSVSANDSSGAKRSTTNQTASSSNQILASLVQEQMRSMRADS